MLAYHDGSGDTHLLNGFSDAILAALAEHEGDVAPSLEELRVDPRLSRLAVGEREIADALWMLEEAGIVRVTEDA